MDPNKLGQLDPKLKAAYDRVMNTAVTPPPPPPPAQPVQTQTGAPPPPPASAGLSAKPNLQPPILNTPAPDLTPISAKPATSEHVEVTKTPGPIAAKFPAYKAGTLKAKSHGSVPMILWVLLAVVFFVAYTLIWIRVLGVSLPFLS